VLPDDVKAIAGPVLSHRLVLSAQSRLRGIRPEDVIDELLTATPVGAEP
jgi:MoxR-like ATPase